MSGLLSPFVALFNNFISGVRLLSDSSQVTVIRPLVNMWTRVAVSNLTFIYKLLQRIVHCSEATFSGQHFTVQYWGSN